MKIFRMYIQTVGHVCLRRKVQRHWIIIYWNTARGSPWTILATFAKFRYSIFLYFYYYMASSSGPSLYSLCYILWIRDLMIELFSSSTSLVEAIVQSQLGMYVYSNKESVKNLLFTFFLVQHFGFVINLQTKLLFHFFDFF